VTIEVQCTSCHTRYRIDEQVLPEGTPTFKCSRCGHVFSLEPRDGTGLEAAPEPVPSMPAPPRAPRPRRQPQSRDAGNQPPIGEKSMPDPQSGWVVGSESPDSAARKGVGLGFPRTVTTPSPPAPASAPPSFAPPSSAPALSVRPSAAPLPPTSPPAEPSSFASATSVPPSSEPPVYVAPPAATPPPPAAPAPEPLSHTDDLLHRPFREETPDSGENLTFDFNDDQLHHETPAAAKSPADRLNSEWQVGEPELETPPAPPLIPRSQPAFASANADAAEPDSKANRLAMRTPKRVEDEEFLDEDAAPIYNRGAVTHSARFFVGLFLLIALGYGAITIFIRSAPATAAEMLSHLPRVGDRFVMPIAPARMVAMRDVHADYLHTKGGHTVLVVTGIAENVSERSLHAVQIEANLRDARQHPIANQVVFCGNNLSASMVSQMTPHELEFFQKLDPPKAFTLDPSTTSPFVIVFVDPPSVVSGFDVSVASASAATEAPVDAING
jgi:predicted Zn finger-like uncharacterized protein